MVKKQTIPKAMIAIFDEREGRPSTDSRERKIALGNGRIKIAITTVYLQRDVNLDRLVMCNHLSTAISDVKRAVTEKKYVALVLLSASITSVIIGLFLQCEYDLQSDAICKRLAATVRGWAITPVHKSVIANALRRRWKGVLLNVFFQIAAKIRAFPTTANGHKTAIMME